MFILVCWMSRCLMASIKKLKSHRVESEKRQRKETKRRTTANDTKKPIIYAVLILFGASNDSVWIKKEICFFRVSFRNDIFYIFSDPEG